MSIEKKIKITVNGKTYERSVNVRTTLVDFLRNDLRLSGTHVGCEHGVCGACTILFDGEAVRSCIMLAVQADGASLTTVEGLADNGKLNALQSAFQERHALQCGFCTPGFLMTATSFLKRVPNPSLDQTREAISGNICRCTGYKPIIEAILDVSKGEK